MDITKAGVVDAVFKNLDDSFKKGINTYKPMAQKLYEVVKSTSASNAYNWLGHLGSFRKWYRGQERVLRNVKTYRYEVANDKFELTIRIPVDDFEDNQLGQYSTVAKSIGAKASQVPDRLVYTLFNNGFDSSKLTTYDGEAWFSNSHTVGISTIDNLITPALDAAALNGAIDKMSGYVFKGDKESEEEPLCPNMQLILLVPPELRATARKLLEMERNDAGASNDLYKQAEPMVSPWLNNATAWFLVNVGDAIKPVYLQKRLAPVMRELNPQNSDGGFMNDEYIVGGKCRYAALPTLPWLVIGSNGTT